jgi:predicted 2-oxoglutarate/Fe(II)-dependent dioxygenase YbiX
MHLVDWFIWIDELVRAITQRAAVIPTDVSVQSIGSIFKGHESELFTLD